MDGTNNASSSIVFCSLPIIVLLCFCTLFPFQNRQYRLLYSLSCKSSLWAFVLSLDEARLHDLNQRKAQDTFRNFRGGNGVSGFDWLKF